MVVLHAPAWLNTLEDHQPGGIDIGPCLGPVLLQDGLRLTLQQAEWLRQLDSGVEDEVALRNHHRHSGILEVLIRWTAQQLCELPPRSTLYFETLYSWRTFDRIRPRLLRALDAIDGKYVRQRETRRAIRCIRMKNGTQLFFRLARPNELNVMTRAELRGDVIVTHGVPKAPPKDGDYNCVRWGNSRCSKPYLIVRRPAVQRAAEEHMIPDLAQICASYAC